MTMAEMPRSTLDKPRRSINDPIRMSKRMGKRQRPGGYNRRPNGEGSVYPDGPSFRAEITWLDESGEKQVRKRRAKTQHGAYEVLQVLREQVRTGRVVSATSAKTTVTDALRTYVAEAQRRGVKARTLSDYRRLAEKVIIPALGRLRANALRRRDVVRFLDAVAGDRQRQYAYVLAKAALSPYVRHVDPCEHPFPPRSTPKVKRRPYVPLTATERHELLAAVADDPLAAYYPLAIASGLRESEALGLRWCDVAEDHVLVRGKLDESTRTLDDPKTASSRRRVDVPASVIEALEAHRRRLREQRDAYAAWKASPPRSTRRDRPNPLAPPAGSPCRPSDLVFVNRRGKPVLASNLRRSWRALRARLGLPDTLRLYDFRHEHGSVLAAADVHPKVVQERMGHSSIRQTMDTYSHLMPGMQRQAVDAIAAALTPPTIPPNA